jgi:UDP-glucose 4-epimerase
MRAVVTGCAGFIGSHLVERLVADGWRVTGVDSFTPYYDRADKQANLASLEAEPRFDLVAADVATAPLDRLLADRPAVLHLAAQPGVRASFGEAFDRYVHDNVLATQRIFEAAAAADCRRVVYASSSSVYGDAREMPLREDLACHPMSPYGVTKLAAEHLGRLYERNHGLPVVSLRYFTVYGPRQRPDMAFHRFLKAARDGETIRVYGDGRQTRDFTYIEDIVAATRAAADSGRPGCVYNVGGGERVSVNQVLEMVEQVTGRTPPVAREEAQKGDVRDTSADTTAARRDLGFRSTVPLREGLAREWSWIQEAR